MIWVELAAAYTAGIATAVIGAVAGGRWYLNRRLSELGALAQLLGPLE